MFFPTYRSLRRHGDGGRCPLTIAAAFGGRCPLMIAAALGHDDFESGSDSKS